MTDCDAEVGEIVDLTEPTHCDSDGEIDNETPLKSMAFSYGVHCLETVKTYLKQQDVNIFFSASSQKRTLLSQKSKIVKNLLVSTPIKLISNKINYQLKLVRNNSLIVLLAIE
ncbi:hypothetical protein TNCV_1147331 [Trichonephila clavipes]|nr:hypothetical protein TNCV_1147331 [Trichonephila clavipes]